MIALSVRSAYRLDALERINANIQSRRAVANGVDEAIKLIRIHLSGLAATRHTTAARLGAAPTGHIRAQAVRRDSINASGAVISIGIPGIGRAFRDITIRPREARALTIPVHRLAYGRTARDLARDLGSDSPLFKPKGKNYLAAQIDGQLTVLYLLRAAVRQPRDASLLPAMADITTAFRNGYAAALHRRGVGGAS